MGCLERLCGYGFLALVCLITLTEGEKDFGPEETAPGLTINESRFFFMKIDILCPPLQKVFC